MKKLMKRNRKVKMYLTKKQLQFLSVVVAFRVWIGGRGSGKSTAIAYSIFDKVKRMPGSAGLLTCITLDQLKTNTLSSIRKMWARHGWRENVHYYIFKKPPQFWIDKAIAPPTEFKNVIFFKNGTWIKVVSAKQYDAARGGSYDWAEIDEAAFFPKKFYEEILDASVRGNRGRWNCTTHHQISFYSSMPYTSEGKWVLDFEDLAKSDPADFYYMESTAYDNIHVYGKEKLERSKKLLSYLKFQVEYMNMRVIQAVNGYYHQFDDRRHLYGDIDEDVKDLYYNLNKPIDLSFDLGGWFSCAGASQEYNNTEYILHDFDAKKKESLKDLCVKFNDAFPLHRKKIVRVYGDPRGHDASEHGYSSYEFITKYLEELGWTVDMCVTNTLADSHELRYIQLNNILAEDDPNLPKIRFHRHNCKDTIIAIQMTEVTPEMKKNKKTEKKRDFPQQHAPHHTDKIDYLITQKHGWKFGIDNDIMENDAFVA